jgi:hypothetical protein
LKIANREKTLNKINEIDEHFTSLGFECKREVKTNYNQNSNPADIFENRTNLVDIICRKDKTIYMFELENSRQCIKNIRGMQQAKREWEKLGLNVNICSLGTDEPLDVCDNIPKKDVINNSVRNNIPQTNPKRINPLKLPKGRISVNWAR